MRVLGPLATGVGEGGGGIVSVLFVFLLSPPEPSARDLAARQLPSGHPPPFPLCQSVTSSLPLKTLKGFGELFTNDFNYSPHCKRKAEHELPHPIAPHAALRGVHLRGRGGGDWHLPGGKGVQLED